MKMSQWISKVRLYMEIVKWGTHLKLRIKMRKIQNSIYHKKWCETTSKITSELFTTSPNAGRWSLAVTAIVLLGRHLLVAEYIFFFLFESMTSLPPCQSMSPFVWRQAGINLGLSPSNGASNTMWTNESQWLGMARIVGKDKLTFYWDD
jgi:hypothetical protein